MRKKSDEENFEEAESQAYRCWSETNVPSDISSLFSFIPSSASTTAAGAAHAPFYHLLEALRKFTAQPPYTLPLSSTLPDMKANTTSYIHLQTLYKTRAEEERDALKGLLAEGVEIDESLLDSFVKNAHGLKVLRGKRWGTLDKDAGALGEYCHLANLPLVLSEILHD